MFGYNLDYVEHCEIVNLDYLKRYVIIKMQTLVFIFSMCAPLI